MSRNPSPGKVDAKGTTRACNQVEATRKPTPAPRHGQGWDQGYDHDFHQNCDILWCSQRITISRSSSFDHSVLVQPAEDPKVAVVIFNHGCAYETSSRDLKNSYQPQCVEKLRIRASRPAMVVLHPHEHPFSCSPRTFAFFFQTLTGDVNLLINGRRLLCSANLRTSNYSTCESPMDWCPFFPDEYHTLIQMSPSPVNHVCALGVCGSIIWIEDALDERKPVSPLCRPEANPQLIDQQLHDEQANLVRNLDGEMRPYCINFTQQ